MVVSAAWYNPFSWFKKAPASVAQPIETQTDAEIHTAETVAPTALPVPKPVFSNNITVADPKLQSQINTLIQQNSTLQTQLASLTTQYNILVTQNTALIAQVANANAALKTAQENLYSLDNSRYENEQKTAQDKAKADTLALEIKTNCTDPIAVLGAEETRIQKQYQEDVKNIQNSNANTGATDGGAAPQYNSLQIEKNKKVSAINTKIADIYAACKLKYNQ